MAASYYTAAILPIGLPFPLPAFRKDVPGFPQSGFHPCGKQTSDWLAAFLPPPLTLKKGKNKKGCAGFRLAYTQRIMVNPPPSEGSPSVHLGFTTNRQRRFNVSSLHPEKHPVPVPSPRSKARPSRPASCPSKPFPDGWNAAPRS